MKSLDKKGDCLIKESKTKKKKMKNSMKGYKLFNIFIIVFYL